MLKHGYHKIKETAILLAIPIDLLFDSQINFFWRLFSDCDIFSGLLWTRGEGQQILQIFVAPETVCFCSLYQAVHDGTGFCSADGIYVDPVLPPEGEGTDGAFCGIVVHGNFPISQEEPEIFLLVQTVLECLAGAAFGRNFWKRCFRSLSLVLS